MKYCEQCGAPLGENAKFCSACGTPVALNRDVPVSAAPGTEQQKTVKTEGAAAVSKAKQPIWQILKAKPAYVGIVLLCFAVLIVGIVMLVNRKPSSDRISNNPDSVQAQSSAQETDPMEQTTPGAVDAEKEQVPATEDYSNLVTDLHNLDCTYMTDMYNHKTERVERKEITCTYRIPQINLPGEDVERMNAAINNYLYPIVEQSLYEIKEYGFPHTSGEVSYRWAVNGDDLSLVILNYSTPAATGRNEYMVYNVSVSECVAVTNEEFLSRHGVPLNTYYSMAKQALKKSFENRNSDFSKEDYYAEQLKKTISQSNIEETRPFVDEYGRLCMIAREYALAGADSYFGEYVLDGLSGDEITPEVSVDVPEEDDYGLSDLNVGDSFFYGSYEQDNNHRNGTEDIEWIVLEKNSDRILVVSRYLLDSKRYNDRNVSVSWGTCSLRSWMNETFYEDSFTKDEKENILTYDDPDSVAEDKVFLLSLDQVEQYFPNKSDRICWATRYAVAQNAYVNPSTGGSWWLLRTVGIDAQHVVSVNSDGSIDYTGGVVGDTRGTIRPAMWISIG